MTDGLRLEGLHQVALSVSDLDRAVAFYRDSLGLRLIAQFDPPGIAFFDIGGVRLMLGHAHEQRPSSGVLYFRVANMEAAERMLVARGVGFEVQPSLVHRDDAGQFGPPGAEEWMGFFRDPDDNLLAIAAVRLPASSG